MKIKKLGLLLGLFVTTSFQAQAADGRDPAQLYLSSLRRAVPYIFLGSTVGTFIGQQLREHTPQAFPCIASLFSVIGGLAAYKGYKREFKKLEDPALNTHHSSFFIYGFSVHLADLRFNSSSASLNLFVLALSTSVFLDGGLLLLDNYYAGETYADAIKTLPLAQDTPTENNCYLCLTSLLNNNEKETIEVPLACKCKASKYLHRDCLLTKIKLMPLGQELSCDFCKKALTLNNVKNFKRQAIQTALALLS